MTTKHHILSLTIGRDGYVQIDCDQPLIGSSQWVRAEELRDAEKKIAELESALAAHKRAH